LLKQWGIGRRRRRSLWDADHVTAVSEGGGECDLENIRTLCLRCHSLATRALRERRARSKSQSAIKDAVAG
jgi:5-methylcytosine-specific restriction protein A